ncbi:alpha/beta hydrolase [Actinophytocola sp.]|uniref:alpha/beta hydrolase n=1 Tax=Actinophytocola sp. TaxID=1872138 RepID=UPI003D6A42FB
MARPFSLIRGYATSSRSWDPLVPLLTSVHHVIRIDLLGYGRSAKPDDGDYQIPGQGHLVAAALDRVGVEHCTVVGHSTGGVVATALAAQRPDLITALALINTGPSLDAAIAKPFAVGSSQWSQLTDEQIREGMASAFGRDDFDIPQQFVDDVRGMTYHSFTAAGRASREYLDEKALPDRLRSLGVPLLVIFGEYCMDPAAASPRPSTASSPPRPGTDKPPGRVSRSRWSVRPPVHRHLHTLREANMRLSILDTGHRAASAVVPPYRHTGRTGHRADPVVPARFPRPPIAGDHGARDARRVVLDRGRREYLAMCTAPLFQCPFRMDSHTEMTRISGHGEIDPGRPGLAAPGTARGPRVPRRGEHGTRRRRCECGR